jgi:hypothetical protein
MRTESKLVKALARGLRPPGTLGKAVEKFSDWKISTSNEARAFAVVLGTIADRFLAEELSQELPLHGLTVFFQQVEDKKVANTLRTHGIPHLLRLYDHSFKKFKEKGTPKSYSDTGDLMFVLKILGLYGTEEGLDRIIEAARLPLEEDGFMWSIIFGQFEKGHPQSKKLCHQLGDPLPAKFMGIAFLDLCNALARNDELQDGHPFDTSKGHKLLQRWLTDPKSENESYAISATAALAFIRKPARDRLLALAMDHSALPVQIEAAWASARLGSESGVTFLSRLCKDPRISNRVCDYLRELDRADAVPAEAEEPDFQALAEMASWLSHPNEFGEPPDELEIYDSREMFWPPTDDRRRLWIVRYRYGVCEGREKEDIGVGLVGSITFALFTETNADMRPDEIYALHCCWELQCNEDSRAPKQRSMKAGKKLLDKYNR